MGHRPAGGVESRNVVSKPVKTGVGARAVNKNWPAQVGGSRGNRVQGALESGGGKVLTGVRAEPYKGPSFKLVPLGNALVNNVGKGGPGKGRTLYGQSGLQGTHDQVAGARRPPGRSFDD